VSERDEDIRGLVEGGLAYREVIEECAPVGYVAVQQKGRPAFPIQPVRLHFEIQPLL
jgi:hypothetical protein